MKQQISPAIIAGAVVLVVILIGIIGYKTFGPTPKPVDTRATDPRYQNYLKGMGSGGSPAAPATAPKPGPGAPP